MSTRIDDMIEVLQAHKEGRALESKPKSSPYWLDASHPVWDFETRDYRVKPEPPKPREWYLHIDLIGRASQAAQLPCCTNCVRVREVLEVPSVEPKEPKSDSASE